MSVLIPIFFSSFIIALSGALMPGPLLTVTISETSKRGFHAGPLIILGHGIIEMAVVTALLLGLAPFLKQDWAFVVISLAGGAVLLYLAVGMFRSIPKLTLSFEPDKKIRSKNHLVWTGILMSAINPYWIIWWATIGLNFIGHSRKYGYWGIAFFFSGHILADLVWYAFVSGAVSKGRHLLTDKRYRILIGVCAVFLVVFSVYFFYSGAQKLAT